MFQDALFSLIQGMIIDYVLPEGAARPEDSRECDHEYASLH
jgi:hypothetical protein